MIFLFCFVWVWVLVSDNEVEHSPRVDYILITNLMHWLLFIHKILFSSSYMFRPSSVHLQEDTVAYMQHMVLSLSTRVRGGLSVLSCAPTGHRELWQYHMLHVYNCTLLKMNTWSSKHVGENNILWINNNQFIKLVINTRVGTLIVATIYLQLIQNRYMFRSFTVLHCSHQHCVQPVASDVECSPLSTRILYGCLWRVTIPEAVVIQLVLLMMSSVLLETCWGA